MNPEAADKSDALIQSGVNQVFFNVKAQETPLKPTTLAERQEETRGVLAKRLVGILQLVVVLLLLTAVGDKVIGAIFAFNNKKYEPNNTEFKDIATLTLTALSGLAGTALGFYFGSRDSSSLDKRDH